MARTTVFCCAETPPATPLAARDMLAGVRYSSTCPNSDVASQFLRVSFFPRKHPQEPPKVKFVVYIETLQRKSRGSSTNLEVPLSWELDRDRSSLLRLIMIWLFSCAVCPLVMDTLTGLRTDPVPTLYL